MGFENLLSGIFFEGLFFRIICGTMFRIWGCTNVRLLAISLQKEFKKGTLNFLQKMETLNFLQKKWKHWIFSKMQRPYNCAHPYWMRRSGDFVIHFKQVENTTKKLSRNILFLAKKGWKVQDLEGGRQGHQAGDDVHWHRQDLCRLLDIPDIFHRCMDGVCGEKSVMWRNFKFLHMTDVEKFEISSIVCTICGILLHFTLFCCKICFLAIYAAVAKSVWCNLRAFVWRKF